MYNQATCKNCITFSIRYQNHHLKSTKTWNQVYIIYKILLHDFCYCKQNRQITHITYNHHVTPYWLYFIIMMFSGYSKVFMIMSIYITNCSKIINCITHETHKKLREALQIIMITLWFVLFVFCVYDLFLVGCVVQTM